MAMNVVIDMLKNRNKTSYANGGERRKRRTAGFTMAEMLIVIAIIGVLAAVSFIAVQAHQRSMTQLQYDAIAKEIFVAAQNHLTLAKSENYQDTAALTHNRGTAGNADADKTSNEGEPVAYNNDIYYFTKSGFTTDGSSILDQMLPFGSVELVTGGSFIIRYQPNAARVLDVFYWTDEAKYGISSVDYVTAVDNYRDTEEGSKKDARSKYDSGSGVLGWCGGEDIVNSGVYLKAPEIEVINAEMLLVKVTDKNTDASVKEKTMPLMKLIISGIQSKAKVVIPLISGSSGYIKDGDRVEYDNVTSTYIVVLDSITADGLHFSQLVNGTKTPADTKGNGTAFIPGENISIQAVAYSDTVLTSVVYSGEWTTNSLFENVTEDEEGNKTTKISNIRHLENLNDGVSSVAYDSAYFNKTINAMQTVDLDWNAFKEGVNILKKEDAKTTFKIYDKLDAPTKVDCFLPVSVNYTLNYNGQSTVEISETTGEGKAATTTTKTFTENHSIKGIVVDNVGVDEDSATFTAGGVFGSLTGGEIRNLELVDTKVKLASGDAGALAGSLNGTAVYNVLAHNTPEFETELAKTDATKTTVSTASTGGNAGGLIGSIDGASSVSKSAAALIVSATGGNAGGLIGKSTSTGTVSGCYAGGHTIESGEAVIYSDTAFNVTATRAEGATTGGIAGGLIGDAGSTAISYSYSTCSAKGVTVGGLIGTGSGAINDSYCTGKVSGTTQGAFAGACGTTTDCHYYEIVNEYPDADGGYGYLLPVPKEKTSDGTGKPSGIKAIDETAQSYNEFCGAAKDSQGKDLWNPANPYDAKLPEYYNGRYNLETVEQLGASITKNSGADGDTTVTDFVATHYGDWPAPEIFVVNTKDTTETPTP